MSKEKDSGFIPLDTDIRRKNRIIKKDTFRSTPFINMTDDMLRIVVDIERKWFFKLQKLIDDLSA